MIDTTSYTPDNKFMVLDRSSILREPEKVPVTLIDELLERNLGVYALEKLMVYRAFTKNQKNLRKVKISSLEGEDLTGKNVTVESGEYDYTGFVTTNEATGVRKSAEDNYYSFVFPEGVEDTDLSDTIFHHFTTVLISEDL